MTRRLLLRNGALRGLPIWGVLLFLNATLLIGFARSVAMARGAELGPSSVLLAGWATVALFLVLAGAKPRGSTLDLALPIDGRRIWLAHVGALALMGTVLTVGFVTIAQAAAFPIRGRVPYAVDGPRLMLILEGGLLLALALLQAPKRELIRIPVTRGYIGWVLVVLATMPLLLLPLMAVGAVGGVVLLAMAALVGAWTYRSLPETLALVPRVPGDGHFGTIDAAAEDVAPVKGYTGRWRAALSVFRCLTAGSKEIIALPLIVLFGLLTGGAFEASPLSAEVRDLRFYYIPMAIYMLFMLVGPRMCLLQALDPLPIGRRLLVAGLLLPSALVFVASYGAGALIARYLGPRTEYVNFVRDAQKGTWSVTVPLRVYDVSWDGQPLQVSAPWGETQQSPLLPLSRVARAAAVNPYSAPPGSSVRFAALQISRAAQAVYGVSIPPEQVERDWLETRPDGTVAARGGSLPIRAQRPGLTPDAGPMFPVLMVLVGLPWLLLVAALHRAYRARVPEWGRQAVFWGAVVLFVLLLAAQAVTLVTGVARPWAVRALIEIPVWELGQTAAGTVATWVVSALLLFGAYRLAEAQFLRSEIEIKPTLYLLLDRMRESER